MGKGMCRGAGWQFGVWPIEKGFRGKEKCAESCARTVGCLAFDISPSDRKRGKNECLLYGHRFLHLYRYLESVNMTPVILPKISPISVTLFENHCR